MAVVNGAGGGMPMMNTGVNGATPRPGNEDDELDYEGRLNTYIYDYFVKNQRNDCARAMLNCDMPISTAPRRRDGDMNGSMHTDSKDDLESKIPDDLPLAAVPTDPQGASFLLEWFGLFWDVFSAHQRKAPPASAQAMQYVARTQVAFSNSQGCFLSTDKHCTERIAHAAGTAAEHAESGHDAQWDEPDERVSEYVLPSPERHAQRRSAEERDAESESAFCTVSHGLNMWLTTCALTLCTGIPNKPWRCRNNI